MAANTAAANTMAYTKSTPKPTPTASPTATLEISESKLDQRIQDSANIAFNKPESMKLNETYSDAATHEVSYKVFASRLDIPTLRAYSSRVCYVTLVKLLTGTLNRSRIFSQFLSI